MTFVLSLYCCFELLMMLRVHQLTHKQEQGVELRHLSADPIQSDCNKVVYLVRSQPDLMRFICSNIHNDTSKGLQREYHVYFVPRRTVVCEKVSFPWK